jgi:hypothetical protein
MGYIFLKCTLFLCHVEPAGASFTEVGLMLGSALWGTYSDPLRLHIKISKTFGSYTL